MTCPSISGHALSHGPNRSASPTLAPASSNNLATPTFSRSTAILNASALALAPPSNNTLATSTCPNLAAALSGEHCCTFGSAPAFSSTPATSARFRCAASRSGTSSAAGRSAGFSRRASSATASDCAWTAATTRAWWRSNAGSAPAARSAAMAGMLLARADAVSAQWRCGGAKGNSRRRRMRRGSKWGLGWEWRRRETVFWRR
mmetsp:Transcript_17931/g.47681  ORF Transcript_17931/g.47681 Transcript_17931/m.47681 type:complete len:203 (-) Transcript_17931:86-694(-)